MNETSASHAIAALAALSLVWAIGYLTYARPGSTDVTPQLTEIANSADFKAGQRYLNGEACLALPLQDPDLVIMGSSHVRTNIASNQLSAAINGELGTCSLARWSVGQTDQFHTFLATQNLAPDHLVWLVGPATLLSSTTDQRRNDDARRVFTDKAYRAKRYEDWVERVDAGDAPLDIGAQTYEARLSEQKARLEALDVDAINERVSAHQNTLLFRPKTWEGRFSELYKPVAGSTLKVTERLCDTVTEKEIRLDLVVAPFPQQSLDMLGYDRETYKSVLRDLLPCSDRIVAKSLDEWGLDARHFVNSKMDTDHDYSRWALSVEEFGEGLDDMSLVELLAVFNSDHLNGAGAEIFTREFIEALELD